MPILAVAEQLAHNNSLRLQH